MIRKIMWSMKKYYQLLVKEVIFERIVAWGIVFGCGYLTDKVSVLG